MEAPGYREALSFLTDRTDKTILSGTDVAKLLGLDPRTARERFGITKKGIFITELARKLCRN